MKFNCQIKRRFTQEQKQQARNSPLKGVEDSPGQETAFVPEQNQVRDCPNKSGKGHQPNLRITQACALEGNVQTRSLSAQQAVG